MTRILIIRHGQSEWNAAGRWQGQADPPLTDLGRHQAWSAAAHLGAVDAIVASPLQRAADTAEIIGEQLGVGPVSYDPDLVERDAGEWSGLTKPEIEDAFPGYLAQGDRPPSFETEDALQHRALRALSQIAVTYGDADVLVVSHGGVVYALEALEGIELVRIPNLGGRWLSHDGTDPRSGLTLGDRVILVDPDETTIPAQL